MYGKKEERCPCICISMCNVYSFATMSNLHVHEFQASLVCFINLCKVSLKADHWWVWNETVRILPECVPLSYITLKIKGWKC